MRKHFLTILSAALLFTGCATLSETECRQADWEALGEADGALGYPPERIAEHREACAEYGIAPDAAAYARGRLAGLDRLCTIPGGLAHGRAGRGYSGVCPPGYERDFYDGYQVGRRIHDVRTELERTEEDIDDIEFDLRRNDLDETRRQILYFQLTEKERDRRMLRRELSALEQEARDLISEL
jgi:hypothetical protein